MLVEERLYRINQKNFLNKLKFFVTLIKIIIIIIIQYNISEFYQGMRS